MVRGRLGDNEFFDTTMMDGCFCRFAIFSDTTSDRREMLSDGVRPLPRTAKLGIGTVGFVVWTADQHLIIGFEAGEKKFIIPYRLLVRAFFETATG